MRAARPLILAGLLPLTYDKGYYRKSDQDPPTMPDLAPAVGSERPAARVARNHGPHTDLLPLFLLRYESSNTRRSYFNDLVQFFGTDAIMLDRACAVTFVHVNEYLEQLALSGAQPATVQRRIAALRGFFSWLVALGLLELNPADRHLIRRTQRSRRRDRAITYLTRDESRRLIEAIDQESSAHVRDKALLLTLLHCVLRRSEAQAMDFEHLRKVGQHWILDLPSTKGGSNQFVKVPEQVAVCIDEHRAHYGYETGAVWRSLSNNSNGGRLSTTSIYNIVRRAAGNAGLEGNIGAHTLRHTGCTLAIEAGASLQQVQFHARHKSLETTMIYVHQRDRLNDSAADYIDLS